MVLVCDRADLLPRPKCSGNRSWLCDCPQADRKKRDRDGLFERICPQVFRGRADAQMAVSRSSSILAKAVRSALINRR